jgi:hypothetical protein
VVVNCYGFDFHPPVFLRPLTFQWRGKCHLEVLNLFPDGYNFTSVFRYYRSQSAFASSVSKIDSDAFIPDYLC